ncbi:MAG: TrbI/VirB10 family protein [Terracidiphilus sp.]
MASTEAVQSTDQPEKIGAIGAAAEETEGISAGRVSKRPFVLTKSRGPSGGHLAMMLIVAGTLAVLAIAMVALLSTTGKYRKRTMDEAGKPNLGQAHTGTTSGDLVPNNKVKPTPNGASESGAVNASDIERTKSPKPAQSQSLGRSAQSPKSLNEIGKFEEPDTSPNRQGKWTPPPYGSESAQNQQAEKKAEDALSQPSLVFTAHEQSIPHSGSENQTTGPDNLGLAPGYHVAARLESMASTAVHAPVVAVVEYNYERDGDVIIPAGARAIGKITQADPSGLINITFSSIEFPDGSSTSIDAVGADMNLQAIKGQVTGRQRGKSMLVRSLSGIGETAAMMVGAPNANSSFSEDDLLRMQVANNIGDAGDQQIMQMLTMEHIVVSVPAGTEVYVVFEKSAAVNSQGSNKTIQVPRAGIGLSQSANAEQP